MFLDDPELLHDFVVESIEHLAEVEGQLLTLEACQDSVDIPLVNKVFRSVHSIKGAAGFLGLEKIESLAHRGEEVLNRLRNNEIKPTSEVVNTLLRATDRLIGLLESIETSNDQDISEHVYALERLLAASETPSTATVEDTKSSTDIPPTTCGPNSAGVSAEALREFLIESHDNLEQLERDLIALERDPTDGQLLGGIFRCIHTIKGTAGFLAFRQIEKLTHAGENLLGSLRSGEIELDNGIAAQLFSMIDLIRRQLSSIETTGLEGREDCDAQVQRLNQVLSDRLGGAQTQTSSNDVNPCVTKMTVPPTTPTAATVSSQKTAPTTASFAQASPMTGPIPDAKKALLAPPPDQANNSAAESTIRVDVALLDKLMTRVGELVLARNQILQYTNKLGDSEFLSTSQRLNLITTELQEGVMKTRMQQIGNVWSKFPRMVRDLAAICGKEVRIEMEGKETELDKTIIEAIKDPLTHLVRNTVDHGIEKPSVRAEKGKPMEGCLSLRAFHEGGQVNIEISDDGAGLNLNRIKEKAFEKGLISQEQASRLSEREAAQLIFLPGFSTAETVSNVSGRGVGMDVVKTNIEKIGGTVDIQTEPGQGTTIKIKIPLTLAIIPALVVSCEGNRFAIPQVNLLELVRLDGTQATSSIEWIQGAPVYRLRGRLLPLAYLSNVLKTAKKDTGNKEVINIVVLRADDRQFGLVVDRINDTEEIVVKPLSTQLKGVSVYSGATIMGDGKVALILDVVGLAHSAHVASKTRDRTTLESGVRSKEDIGTVKKLLVLGTGSNRRLALPISQVARLEKIRLDTIEYTDNREVVQYRGAILPLIRLASVLGIEDKIDYIDGLMNVVVYIENEYSYGLVVNKILDIVGTTLDVIHPSQRSGLLGSAVIQDYVTDLVDLPAIIQQLNFGAKDTSSTQSRESN